MISAAEQKDIDEMKVAKSDLKAKSIDYILEIYRMEDDELPSCGYRFGKPDALMRIVADLRKKLTVIEQAFIKKWPDK